MTEYSLPWRNDLGMILPAKSGHFRTRGCDRMGRKKNTDGAISGEPEPELTPVQQTVISALVAGKTYLEAAADAGISARTIRRWRSHCPGFELTLRSQMHDVKESAVLAATSALQNAIKTLTEIVGNASHPQVIPAIRMIMGLAGTLPELKPPTSLYDIDQEQLDARVRRLSTRSFP